MTNPSPETLPVKKQKVAKSAPPPTATEARFSRALEKIVEPFIFWSNASFIYHAPAGHVVSSFGENCGCGRIADAARGRFGAAEHFTCDVEHQGKPLGRVVLCCSPATPHGEKTLQKLVALAIGELTAGDDETALLEELSASWESLQAVYDLNADFSSTKDPKSLLRKITERAIAVGEKVQSVLWLENGDNLEPAAANCNCQLTPRPATTGLTGRVFSNGRSVIFNNFAHSEHDEELDAELKNAFRVAFVPLTTRVATYGVLVVWQESDDFLFDSRKMRLLDTLALQAAMVVENDRLHRESIRNERLNQEIEIGSKIQQTLLSGNPPNGIPGIAIAAESISSQKIDGDFYDFIEHGEDCFDLIIGDVMGKGIPAALVGAATKNSFLRAVGQLQSSEQNLRPSAEKIVTWVNNEVTVKLMQFESFVTACYARFDLARRELTFVDCGHTKTIHYHFRDGKLTFLEGDNMPLGFSEREIFSEKTLSIEPGDVFFFYSDGVTESRNPAGDLFGDERLTEFIRRHAYLEPKLIISRLLENLQEFSTEKKFNDDLTCVAVRFGKTPAEKQGTEMRIHLTSDLKELDRARRFVREASVILPGSPMAEESVDQLQLAVTEAVANVIEHGYRGEGGHRIEMSAESYAGGIRFEIHHWGEGVDPASVPAPVFDDTAEGGFGLFIISNCVDFVSYSTDDQNRSTILLIKNSN
ncbi:MAG: SpoIIE family protein phosphatase [Acidobacteria bacterium]|nr:SpoIIE family protein phosphatase [Acidobacteriota bacterium]